MDAGDEGSAPEVTAEKIREGELCNAQAVNPKAACSNKKRPNGCGVTQHLPGNCQRHGMMALQVPRRLGFGWTVADAKCKDGAWCRHLPFIPVQRDGFGMNTKESASLPRENRIAVNSIVVSVRRQTQHR